MRSIPVVKYTSYGNNFVIVDETQQAILTESEKTRFAYHATNTNFGVGADNFLVVQPCTADVLAKINTDRRYWTTPPDSRSADFIFRMFESDGTEAYSCGNGLLSIANHLLQAYHIRKARIVTEIPTANPSVVTIGTDADKKSNWVIMVPPRKVPESMAASSIRISISDCIDRVSNIHIQKVRQSDAMRFFKDSASLTLSGFLVFTGEPHLVVFTDSGFDKPEIASQIFIPPPFESSSGDQTEKRRASSSAFVDFIGKYFAREFADVFPVGININFVGVSSDSNAIEHRCFERGINHETFACGTGSLASAFVARQLNRIKSNEIAVRPHCCRWTIPEAEITIEIRNDEWRIKGSPDRLFDGTFCWRQ